MRSLKRTTESYLKNSCGVLIRARAALLMLAIAACYSPPAILETLYAPDSFYVSEAGFEIQLEFLDSERLLERARWLNSGSINRRIAFTPPFAPARRAPDLTALQITVLNYGLTPACVNFEHMRIAALFSDTQTTRSTGRILRPIQARAYQAEYAGQFSGALRAYEFAFQQNEIHRFAQPIPDWFSNRSGGNHAGLARDTLSPAERRNRERVRESDNAKQNQVRTRLAPGGEIRGIVLFAMLEENRDYELRFTPPTGLAINRAQCGGSRFFAMPAVRFRHRVVSIKRGEEEASSEPTVDNSNSGLSRSATTIQGDPDLRREQTRRMARDYHRMHEQLRNHERLKQKTP